MQAETFFTADDVIHAYSRAQALEDGVLIDVSSVALEAGIKFPVAITAEAWSDCVAWTEQDAARKGGRCHQDEAGRLWDVIWLLRCAARRTSGAELRFQLHRVPREGRGVRPRLVTLRALCGPGDDGEPVITILLPEQD